MTDLSWTTSWDSIIHMENGLATNQYTMTVYFDVTTEDADEQSIAFERIKFFVEDVLDTAIITSIDNENNSWFMANLKQRLLTIPGEPTDLIIAACLYSKFNAIVEDKLSIDKIELDSKLANNIKIHYTSEFAEESQGLLEHDLVDQFKKTPWWRRTDSGSADYFTSDENDSILFVTDISTWEDAELQWLKPNEESESESKWKPTIIPGGKTLN